MGLRIGFLFDGGETKELVPLKMLFLILFAAFSVQTYLPIYFDSQNFSKMQIGVLLSIPCVCAILSPPIWGAAADIMQNQRAVHIACLLSAGLLMFSIRFVSTFPVMCVMVFAANFQTQPAMSLLDQTAMALLSRVGGDYGKQRLYGAIGYGAGGYAAGVLAATVGIAWCFNMVLALSLLSLFILVSFVPSYSAKPPATSTEKTALSAQEGGHGAHGKPAEEEEGRGDFLHSLALILQKRDLIVLFAIVLLAGLMGGLIDNFLFLYLFNLSGDNANLVGVVIATETVSELPLFFYANHIITRFGTPACIFASLIAYGVRMTVYVFVQNPWLALPIETMHGLTYGLLWAAFTNYVYQSAPEGTEGTMIGLLTAVQKGMGSGVGTLVGGYIYEHWGPRAMWRVAAFGVFPLSLLFAAIFSSVALTFTGQSPTRKHSVASSHEARSILGSYGDLSVMALEHSPVNGYGATSNDTHRKSDLV
ncbi:hypothetical protein PybrP1_007431 [[Pythium] brassicae (nom. inval.)]|nr:hypothetical protein PybrP1_007431 [[Pythium] brassicae (nom. inval.)]